MGNFEKNISKLVTFTLRIAAIMYFFTAIYPFLVDPGFESTFGAWSVRWILIILLGTITLAFFILGKSDFYVYGFFLVLIVSIYQMFTALTASWSITELFLHFYVLSTAVYFVTRDLRANYGSIKHRRHSKIKTGTGTA
ncbi:MAG: hypothetical protein Q7V19_12405 [Bacteroidales bacterium]|nr:hypothetical protein [Bacteroidales bacterium]MDP2235747.1 hypothetical protein [Bacteroidales bacterium]